MTDVVRENEKLRKIVKVLVDRVDRSTNAQGNAFSLFQAAITLENTVRQRTSELQSLNDQLQQEIDERRAVEAALGRAKLEAEQANLGKTEFLRAASHDLLQPLNVARLILGALREREHDTESMAMLERIALSIGDAEGLLSALLEMSRIDAGAMLPEIADVAIDPLLKHLADDYGLQAEERHLRLRVVPCDAIVRTDIRLLERILRNLLSNALRYTEHGGVLLGCRVRENRLRVEVWDTGVGVPPDRLADIFKEFLRLDGPGERPAGMGLGLAIVDRLARLLGANVDVRSEFGRGSVFAIELPLGDASRVRGVSLERRRRGAHGLFADKSVLLIESDPAVYSELAAHLRSWGLFTLEAQTIAGASAVTNAHGVIPSVVLLGERAIAGFEGVDVVASMRARFGEPIPAIVLSEDDDHARRAPAPDCWYLSKPIRVERLRSLLNHLLTESARSAS